MKIAFLIYDGITLLDFCGLYDPVTRLKTMDYREDLTYDVCALDKEVISFEGLKVMPDKIKPDLQEYDYIFIPGGNGIAQLLGNTVFLNWLKNTSSDSVLAAVCGGSLLLGAAGYLQEKRATTHPMMRDYLKKFTDKVSDERIVEDGRINTARGVTAAIDLGLYICEKIARKDVRRKIQKQMDYEAYPFE